MNRMKMHTSYRRGPAARLLLWVAALILICQALYASNASAQIIDYSDTTFTERIDAGFWEFNLRGESIEIDTTILYNRPHRRTIFHWPVTFEGSTFNYTADFQSAYFNSWVKFSGATFDSTALFWCAEFNSNADFIRANFGHFADFRRVRFSGHVSFLGATLPDTLDFRWVTEIEREVDFTFARRPSSGAPCKIALAGADISKIRLRMGLFRLWFQSDLLYDQKASVYESVLKKLEDDGFTESYEVLDIEYRRFKAEHRGWFNWYFLDTWQDWWWN